jgi:hypothetical protein
MQSKYGSITPEDMMGWSRLHSSDIGGMRGMCEGEEKAAMVFKIPYSRFDILSMGWFAPDQCSSIFVPVHISDTNMLYSYENGEAADMAKKLLNKFGHGNITDDCIRVENVLVKENDRVEALAVSAENAGEILTLSDMGMQRQAMLMQKIFLTASDDDRTIAVGVWNESYHKTLCNIRDVIKNIGNSDVKNKLASVALNIVKARAEMAKIAKNDDRAMMKCEKGERLIKDGRYGEGMYYVVKAYECADSALFEARMPGITMEEKRNDYVAVALGIILAGALLFVLIRKRM